MKDWPPKPGSTVMTSTMSACCASSITALTAARARPLHASGGRDACNTHASWASGRCRTSCPPCGPRRSAREDSLRAALRKLACERVNAPVASTWNVKLLAPALAKSSTHCSGRETMRWQSRKPAVCFRRHFTSGAPNVKLGTKCLRTGTFATSAGGRRTPVLRSALDWAGKADASTHHYVQVQPVGAQLQHALALKAPRETLQLHTHSRRRASSARRERSLARTDGHTIAGSAMLWMNHWCDGSPGNVRSRRGDPPARRDGPGARGCASPPAQKILRRRGWL
jgi:hypothetical protein